MLGNSGASVNVIDEPTLETLAPTPDMQPPDMNLYAYGSKEKALPYLECSLLRSQLNTSHTQRKCTLLKGVMSR